MLGMAVAWGACRKGAGIKTRKWRDQYQLGGTRVGWRKSLSVSNPPFLASSPLDNHRSKALYNLFFNLSSSYSHHCNMDSFSEPYRVTEPIKLEDLTAEVLARSAEYHAKGIPLSGRIIHVCHYLPITATLQQSSRPGIISPPATPPHQLANIHPFSTESTASSSSHVNSSSPRWSISGRQGHTAMVSGIRSLSATHEQFIIGWTGDIESPNTNSGMWRGTTPFSMTSSPASLTQILT